MKRYVIGIDFGTDSVRSLVVDAAAGQELGSATADYRRWADGLFCRPETNRFRQHPLDYLEAMEESVNGALEAAGSSAAEHVVGIGIDTTGSTPCLVDRGGTPLALKEGFEENPNAMFIVWKDHTAVREAEEINAAARSWGGIDFTRFEGGIYSSEWFWSKLLHVLREDEAVGQAAFSFVEHCDWQAGLLTGNTDPTTMMRSRCAAGHKAMWHTDWHGLPDEAFLLALDPALRGWRGRLFSETQTSDRSCGSLTPQWAGRLGLPPETAVAVGAFDAHMGAVGGGITPGAMVKIMGTSTCDMIVSPPFELRGRQVAGICGQVDGSVIPGLIGLEAGQSAFGDVFAWFANFLAWPFGLFQKGDVPDSTLKRVKNELLASLDREADSVHPRETGILALDWLNGRRTPDADQSLKGAVIGLSLSTTAPKIHRALVEATAFGSRATMDRFLREGVNIEEVIAVGGISQKAPFVMQVTSDVMGTPIKVSNSEQTCALGAAMFGAVAAGLYDRVEEAQDKMGCGFDRVYSPDPERASLYAELYKKYLSVGGLLETPLREL